jgi:glycosyltransferase involved in cell wall biosynthesis
MRILFTARALTIGGAERQLSLLARGLAARGHAVGLVLFYEGGVLEAELAHSGVEILSLAKRSRWDPSLLWRWPSIVRAWAPDVVHGYLTVANMLALTARFKRSAPLVVWGIRATSMDLSRYDASHRLTEKALRLAVRAPDLVIANSTAAAREVRSWGAEESRVVTIANGVDTARFVPDAAARRETREALRIEPGQIAVGLIGRLDPMKDHATFLEAAGSIAARDPRLVFVIAGDGPQRPRIVADVERRGLSDRVRLVPARRDPERLYPALDVIVSSSAFGEGFSNVLAEAMACGVPAVATDVGDASLLLGSREFVVPPRDPTALAEAIIERLSREPEHDLRASIVERFSVEAMVARTEAALQAASAARSAQRS